MHTKQGQCLPAKLPSKAFAGIFAWLPRTSDHACTASKTGRRTKSHPALDFPGVLVIDSAADADTSAQDLLDSAGQLARAAAVAHNPRNFDHLVQLQVATVLDVLLLQAQAQHMLETSWKVAHPFVCKAF